jgi:hypothetical protein
MKATDMLDPCDVPRADCRMRPVLCHVVRRAQPAPQWSAAKQVRPWVLHQVGTFDRKEGLAFFHVVADLGEQARDAALVICEDLDSHVFVVIDASAGDPFEPDQMFANRFDLDRCNLLFVDGIGSFQRISRIQFACGFGWPPKSP